jgi:hypothetical protein
VWLCSVTGEAKESAMMHARALGIAALGLVVSTYALRAESPSRYRNFQLGSDLSSVSALTGVAASEAKIIHVRPALMQELQWRRGYTTTGDAAAASDPVQQIVFSFYNNQLTKLVVDYDHDRTAGMTDADMVIALSMAYGPSSNPAVRKGRPAVSLVEEESGAPVARWGNADYSVVLYRSPYASGFRLIVVGTKLEALARVANAEAIRLDQREAPQREIARQKKEMDDSQASREKARRTNNAAFRP